MKTEGLSLMEGIQAYGSGQIVQDRHGNQYQIHNDRPMYKYKYGKKWQAHKSARVSAEDAPFSIILPEEKSLTFEEAVDCENVKIHWPPALTYPADTGVLSKSGAWNLDEIAAMDLAERRGWKITEVKK